MTRKSVLRSSLLIALAASAFSFALSDTVGLAAPSVVSSFDAGVKLYNQKQYRLALPIFMEFLKANPRSAAAYLYIANSYYGLQQYAAAKQTYQVLAHSFPNSSEAYAASDILRRLQPATGVQPTASAGAAKHTETKPEESSDSESSSIGELTLRVIKPVQDHPAVSAPLIRVVKGKLAGYPKQIRKLLAEHQIEVVLTPTLIDKNPEMKNEEGRGYDGHTLKSCPGMFQGGRMIVICERTMDESTEAIHDSMPTKDILHTLNHECGHAIDRCLGDLSETEEFKHAYLLDSASAQRADASVSRDLAYYLQKSVAGQQECCGELFGIILGTEDETSEKMKAAFPQTIKLLKKKLGV